MAIGGRVLGDGSPPLLVAELSGNHGGSLDTAKALVRAAAEAGAGAVKLQTYTADTLTLPFDTAPFRIESGLWAGRTLHDLYTEAMTPWEWHRTLADLAEELGLLFFSTPFDETAVDFLEQEIDPPAHKIASFELTHLPLLQKVAATGKPVLLSTGMATAEEIGTAVATLREDGCEQLVLLHCVSAYPAPLEACNLRTIADLAAHFGCLAGLSDHTLGPEAALGATALGAVLIEKHLTTRRADGAVDAAFSLEPAEFAQMARGVGTLHAALGAPSYGPSPEEAGSLRHRRSIFVKADIARGEVLSAANLQIVRPADGLPPARWAEVLGKTAAHPLKAGEPLRAGDFS